MALNYTYSIMSLRLLDLQTIGCQCSGELGIAGLKRELWSLMRTDTI